MAKGDEKERENENGWCFLDNTIYLEILTQEEKQKHQLSGGLFDIASVSWLLFTINFYDSFEVYNF